VAQPFAYIKKYKNYLNGVGVNLLKSYKFALMTKLAIIEDTESIRDILEAYFSNQPNFDLQCVASSAEAFFKYNAIDEIDVVLCDIGLPGKSGMETAWILKQKHPLMHIVMFTVFEDKDKIFQSLQAGASGYFLKDTPLPQLKEGLLDVINGGAAMSPQIAKEVVNFFRLSKPNAEAPVNLTARELDVVSQAQKGLSNRLIAERLFVSVDTVKYHIKNIYDKLQINSREELKNYFNNPFS